MRSFAPKLFFVKTVNFCDPVATSCNRRVTAVLFDRCGSNKKNKNVSCRERAVRILVFQTSERGWAFGNPDGREREELKQKPTTTLNSPFACTEEASELACRAKRHQIKPCRPARYPRVDHGPKARKTTEKQVCQRLTTLRNRNLTEHLLRSSRNEGLSCTAKARHRYSVKHCLPPAQP